MDLRGCFLQSHFEAHKRIRFEISRTGSKSPRRDSSMPSFPPLPDVLINPFVEAPNEPMDGWWKEPTSWPDPVSLGT